MLLEDSAFTAVKRGRCKRTILGTSKKEEYVRDTICLRKVYERGTFSVKMG